MNAKERFMKALRLEPVDRPPVAAVVTGLTVWMMEQAGIFWPEAHGRIPPGFEAGVATLCAFLFGYIARERSG